MQTKGLFVNINAELKEELDRYCEKTGRSLRFTVENGIAIAVATDCQYGPELVPLVIGKHVHKVPIAVAEAFEQKMASRSSEEYKNT